LHVRVESNVQLYKKTNSDCKLLLTKVIYFNVSTGITNAAFITIRILGVTTLDIVRANTFVAEAKVNI